MHLIDWHGDLYGEPLEVDFLARLRDIQRFDGADGAEGAIEQRTSTQAQGNCGVRKTSIALESRQSPALRTPHSTIHARQLAAFRRCRPRARAVSCSRRTSGRTVTRWGAAWGWREYSRNFGKSVRIVNGQATPPNLKFIDPQNRIQAVGVNVQGNELLADDFEVVMVLDTSAWAQLGPMADIVRGTRAKKIVLDHHQSSDDLRPRISETPARRQPADWSWKRPRN